MFLNNQCFFILVFYLCSPFWPTCSGKVSYYIVTERPEYTYYNRSYLSYANISSRRHGRGNPIYYVDFHIKSLVPADNTYKVDFYFFELLSNVYKRGFVEMHFRFCDLIDKDAFFGATIKKTLLGKSCPYPPGEYHMYNMSIPSAAIPPGFPFTKGRIYMNLTHGHDYVLCGHIDMELKEKRVRPGRT